MTREELIEKLVAEGGKVLPVMTDSEVEEVVDFVLDNYFIKSQGLEVAAEKCIESLIPETELNSTTPFALEYVVELLHKTFKAGAEWQKEIDDKAMEAADKAYFESCEKIRQQTIERTLVLPLKAQWYNMIESGEKKDEYREDKPYWQKRLDGKEFDAVTFTYGYTKRRMTYKCNGIRKGTGNPKWGAVSGEVYYIISLGERIN